MAGAGGTNQRGQTKMVASQLQTLALFLSHELDPRLLRNKPDTEQAEHRGLESRAAWQETSALKHHSFEIESSAQGIRAS